MKQSIDKVSCVGQGMTSRHGEKSYHLTTTKTPKGDMSYGRIKFADCVHHYTLKDDYHVFVVEVYDLKGNIIFWGDEMDITPNEIHQHRPTRSHAIMVAKSMVEYHLNDDFPLWTPSGWTTDPTPYYSTRGIE